MICAMKIFLRIAAKVYKNINKTNNANNVLKFKKKLNDIIFHDVNFIFCVTKKN